MKYPTNLYLESAEELEAAINKYKDTAGKGLSISFSEEWSKRYRKSPQTSIKAITDIAVNLPDLESLTPSMGLIPIEVLQQLNAFKNLKSLSLYWSGLNHDSFFEYIPESLEELNLARTVACKIHGTKGLRDLLERLKNLKSLDLAETNLRSFPKLSEPNLNLEKLELFHHTIYQHNNSLDGNDLKHIAFNFPNLKELNIIACDAIDITDPKTKKALETLAARDNFVLDANKPVSDYFYHCQSIIYLKTQHGLSDQQIQNIINTHPKWIALLTSFNAKFLLKNNYTVDQLIQMLNDDEPRFIKLTSSKAFDFVKHNILSFAELSKLHDQYGEEIQEVLKRTTKYLILENHITLEKLLELYALHGKAIKSLLSHETQELICRNKIPSALILKTFEFSPDLLATIISFDFRHNKTGENMVAEIEMIMRNSSEPVAYKRLEQQNTTMSELKLNYLSNQFVLNAAGLENVLFNFPNLQKLTLDEKLSKLKLSREERDKLISVFEQYLLINPEFKLNGSSRALKVFNEAKAMLFYSKNKGITHAELLVQRRENPKMFTVLAQPNVCEFSNVIHYDFKAIVELYQKHPKGFKKFTSTDDGQTIVKNNWMSFAEILQCYEENKKRFEALVNYKTINIINEYHLTWDEISQVFDKNEEVFNKILEIDANSYCNPNAGRDINHLKDLVLSGENVTDEIAAALTKQIDPATYFNTLRANFFAGTKVAFTKSQARLAAEFYYQIIENGLIDSLYTSLKYSDGSLTILNDTKKKVFIDTLEDKLWQLLSTDLSLSIQGQSPLYLGWSHKFITEALKKADIALDNSKSILIFVFIGQYDSTTYQLADDVGDCEDYLGDSAKPEIMAPAVERLNILTGSKERFFSYITGMEVSGPHLTDAAMANLKLD